MGSAGMGLYYKEQISGRVRALRQLHKILELLMSEIRFGRCTLPECCHLLSETMEEPYSRTFREIYEECCREEGVGFSVIFRGKMETCLKILPLREEDIGSFLWFVQPGGVPDKEMQIKLLEESHQQVSRRILTEEAKEQSRGQLAMSLGIMGGLLLIIVFI